MVVFPAPFGPMSPTSSCGRICRLKLSTAVNPPKRIVTLLASSSGAFGSLGVIRGVPPREFSWNGRRLASFLAARENFPQLAAAEESLRAGEHEGDQHQRVDDHPWVFAARD